MKFCLGVSSVEHIYHLLRCLFFNSVNCQYGDSDKIGLAKSTYSLEHKQQKDR